MQREREGALSASRQSKSSSTEFLEIETAPGIDGGGGTTAAEEETRVSGYLKDGGVLGFWIDDAAKELQQL